MKELHLTKSKHPLSARMIPDLRYTSECVHTICAKLHVYIGMGSCIHLSSAAGHVCKGVLAVTATCAHTHLHVHTLPWNACRYVYVHRVG